MLGWRALSPFWRRLGQPVEASPPCAPPHPAPGSGPRLPLVGSESLDDYRPPLYLQNNGPGILTSKNGEEVSASSDKTEAQGRLELENFRTDQGSGGGEGAVMYHWSVADFSNDLIRSPHRKYIFRELKL